VRALLDTHAFLWWNADDERLSAPARAVIGDGRNEILLSAASAWEIAIKVGRGRLTLPLPPARYVPDRMRMNGFTGLPVEIAHAVGVAALPNVHSDPFDRLIVAQAIAEGIPIITADPDIGRYPIETIW
jgi:PIN domain nuclease of toxin-antitoxin system